MRDHLFQNVMLKNGPRLAEFFALAENYLYIGMALVQCSITGKDVWGEPHDRNEAIRVLRRTLEQGINFIDTADSYGPEVSEQLIAEALHPYPNDLVIATKAGFDRSGPGQWTMNGNPKHLREACEGSLRRLKVERIDLYQLHRIDPHYQADDQFGVFKDLQSQGKIRYVGLSEVTVDQIEHAAKDCAGRYSAESLQPGRSVL
jgi:pyridoxine 4-dehydrogenase